MPANIIDYVEAVADVVDNWRQRDDLDAEQKISYLADTARRLQLADNEWPPFIESICLRLEVDA